MLLSCFHICHPEVLQGLRWNLWPLWPNRHLGRPWSLRMATCGLPALARWKTRRTWFAASDFEGICSLGSRLAWDWTIWSTTPRARSILVAEPNTGYRRALATSLTPSSLWTPSRACLGEVDTEVDSLRPLRPPTLLLRKVIKLKPMEVQLHKGKVASKEA